MSSTASVGLVWGLPVRPDLLGQALQAYQSALPTLTALRLCHRLGKGPNVHITKLPPEILLAIEDMIFDRKLEYYPWLDAFKHYESRCEPVEHLEDGYCDIFAEVKDEINDEMCSMCKGESLWCPDECTEDCAFKVEMKMNEGMCENGSWTYDCCEPECDGWEELIAQGEGGNFTSYDEVRNCTRREPFKHAHKFLDTTQELRTGSIFRYMSSHGRDKGYVARRLQSPVAS